MHTDNKSRSYVGGVKYGSYAWGDPLRATYDLAGALILSVGGALAASWSFPAPVRIFLAILFIMFLPGYALVAALFPRRDTLDTAERVMLSFALSLALVPVVALVIDFSPWRVRIRSITVVFVLFIALCVMIAHWRRLQLPVNEQYRLRRPQLALLQFGIENQSPSVALWTITLAVILFSIGGGIVIWDRLHAEPMTEFALYSASDQAAFYPRSISPGQPTEVHLEVTNHEGRTVTYRVGVSGSGLLIGSPPLITLPSGKSWRGSIQFAAVQLSDDLRPVLFELYRVDQPADPAPYRTLRLMLDTRATPASSGEARP